MAVVFFTDRDLGKRFPAILRDAGLTVERHGDHFRHDTDDVEWIADVARRGWIALTHDKAISRRHNEREAVLSAGLGLLIIVGAARHQELAENFVVTLPRIASYLATHAPPFIAKVHRPAPADLAKGRLPIGRIEHWRP